MLVTIAIFIVCREFVCWYFKINQNLDLQRKILKELKRASPHPSRSTPGNKGSATNNPDQSMSGWATETYKSGFVICINRDAGEPASIESVEVCLDGDETDEKVKVPLDRIGNLDLEIGSTVKLYKDKSGGIFISK